jgi:hypothetical protein
LPLWRRRYRVGVRLHVSAGLLDVVGKTGARDVARAVECTPSMLTVKQVLVSFCVLTSTWSGWDGAMEVETISYYQFDHSSFQKKNDVY